MIDYLTLVNKWMEIKHYQLIILIIAYMLLSTLDFIGGSVNAAITKDVEYSSKVAQMGIMRKLFILATMIIVIPLAMMLPLDIGAYALTVLYMGIVMSELYSVLAHVGLVKDKNKGANMLSEVIEKFLSILTKGGGQK